MPDNNHDPRSSQVTPWVAPETQVAVLSEEGTRPGLIRSWVGPARRRWRAGLTVVLLVLGATALVLLTAKPLFRADARLRLSEPPPVGGVSSPNTSLISLLSMGGDAFSNDLELLASRSVAEQVVEDAALNAKVIAPRGWYRDSLFTKFEADRSTVEATFRVEWLGNGRIAVRMASPRDSAIAEVAPQEAVTFGGLTVAFAARRPDMPRTIKIATQPFDDVARALMTSIRVERTRREANVLSIVYDDNDPRVTRDVVAAAVRHFMVLRAHIQARESGETVDSIRSVASATKTDLANAEDALEDWQRRTLLVAPEPQSEAFVQRYMAVISELESARLEYGGIDSVFARLNADPGSSRAWVTLLSYPKFLENETVSLLLARMSELEEQQLELISRRAETSREFQVLSSQTKALDTSLRDLAARSRTVLGERIGDLEMQVAALDRELARLPGNAVELARRQRDVLLLSELVVLTEQRLRQEELRQALTTSNVQVIDPPQLIQRPLWPRPKLGAAVGLMLAGIFGLLAMVVAETADPTARTAAQVRTLIGAPVLATAVWRKGGVQIAERDAAAVAALAARRDSGTLTLAAASREDATGVAGALVSAAAASGSALVAVGVSSPVLEFGAAAEAADAPVVLVVEAARTRKHDMGRAAARVREAGGVVLGAVVLCRNDREARAVWG